MDHVETIANAYGALAEGNLDPLVSLIDSGMEWRGVPHRHFLRNHYPS